MRLFDRLDYDILRDCAKIFTGYSDITSLHLALTQQPGYVTFYSPNVTSLPNLNALSQEMFWKLLESPALYGPLPAPPDGMQTLVPGSVEGELAGGCLCLLAHACGSRHTPDFKNKIVLIEDVNEAIYRADRDLMQLRNTGALNEAAGFILGTISHWHKERSPTRLPTRSTRSGETSSCRLASPPQRLSLRPRTQPAYPAPRRSRPPGCRYAHGDIVGIGGKLNLTQRCQDTKKSRTNRGTWMLRRWQ